VSNNALESLHELEKDYARVRRTDLAPLSAAEQRAVRQLAADLPAVWDAATTTAVDRKSLLRLVIQEVAITVQNTNPRTAQVSVLWSGGMTTSHTIACKPMGWHCSTVPATIEEIRALAQRLPDHRIAETLNAKGLLTKTGK
jgi:hypothetical protein